MNVTCALARSVSCRIQRACSDIVALRLSLPQNLYKKFIKDEEPPKAFFDALGSNRDYNVDLVPKFIMAGGE